jgi:hypothetical protein
MIEDFECLSDIDEINKIIKCRKYKANDKFKKMGFGNRRRKITEQELFNRRMYRELFPYKFYVN